MLSDHPSSSTDIPSIHPAAQPPIYLSPGARVVWRAASLRSVVLLPPALSARSCVYCHRHTI